MAGIGLPATPASAAVVPPPPGAVVVGAASATCPAPAFATITAAVVASPAGSTIYVCAGLYNENVPITKNLTLLGAQFGVDARTGRTNPAEESIVSSPTGEFNYLGAATTGTIDGFTLQGAPVPAGDDDGILAVNTGDGYAWINNVITGNTTGINFRASGAVPTLINHNRITDNTAAGSSSGNGIFFTNGPVNNVTISDNAFARNRPAIDTTGVGDLAGGRSVNVTVSGNTSLDDGNFIALFLAQHVQITGNAIGWTNPNDPAAGSAIFVSGGNSDVTVANNTIDGGASSGINLNNLFYSASPSTNVRVTANTITRRNNGVRIPAGTAGSPPVVAATISGNQISAAGVGDSVPDPSAGGNGIWIQGGSQFTITGNVAALSVSTDCRDETTGGGTAGTANGWTGNTGATSFPTGLCGILVSPSITGVINATSVKVGGSLQQTITVSGTAGQPGVLNWQLLGPVPAQHYSCAGASFAGAPVLAAGTQPVTGDGPLAVPATVVHSAGCYTFTDALTGPSYTTSPTIPAGDPANTALASKKILPVTGPVGAVPLATTGTALIFAGTVLLWTTRQRRTA